jgi:uncharacterized protein YyaL (SSP411 family)
MRSHHLSANATKAFGEARHRDAPILLCVANAVNEWRAVLSHEGFADDET